MTDTMTDQEHSEDLEDMVDEVARLQTSLRIACENIAQLSDQRTQLSEALNTATLLIDQLLTDLRLAGGSPSQGLLIAKANFDVTMQRLLGHERTFRKIDEGQ